MTKGVLTPGRQAVEKLLADHPTQAFGTRDVALRTGLPLDEVRSHLGNATYTHRIHNTTPEGPLAHYRHGPAPQKPIAFRPRAGDYDGKELQPYTGRPGAMRAFELPSVVAGQVVARVAPVLITSKTARSYT